VRTGPDGGSTRRPSRRFGHHFLSFSRFPTFPPFPPVFPFRKTQGTTNEEGLLPSREVLRSTKSPPQWVYSLPPFPILFRYYVAEVIITPLNKEMRIVNLSRVRPFLCHDGHSTMGPFVVRPPSHPSLCSLNSLRPSRNARP